MNKICFIVGHGKSKSGGYDPGAVSGTAQEFKIAREIAKYAQAYYNATYQEQADLMNYNADLYLTDRIDKVNASGYDFVAEIHLNAGGGTGTECYHSSGNSKGNHYAAAIAQGISTSLGIKNRGARTKLNSSVRDYFAIIRETKPTAVLIETAFIDTNDLDKINDAAGRAKCGEAIAKAVASVRGAATKPKTVTPTKPPGKLYRVQTGAFSSAENAQKMADKLKKAGYDTIIKSE